MYNAFPDHTTKKYPMKLENNYLYPLALKLGKGIGPVLYKSLIDEFGSAKNIFCTEMKHIGKVKKGGFDISSLLQEKEVLLSKAAHLSQAQKRKSIKTTTYGEQGYPQRLAQLHAPPPLLYYKGNAKLTARHVVSIVGTRYPTHYGKEVTKALVGQLKAYDTLIVSGLAYGIDITAHQEALAQGMRTIAVMPGGLDMIYPPDHIHTVEAITKAEGAVISEYGLGTRPMQHYFPARNKVIAGIADATIVVEAPKRSGALITAYYANEFNRDVFAVPGPINSQSNEGCHQLIKKHLAHLLTHVNDLAYVMNWSKEEDRSTAKHYTMLSMDLTPLEKKTVTLLANSPKQAVTMDALQRHLNIPTKEITAITLALELKGILLVTGHGYMLV
ncbi:MAG: DNA-processing protein DprA [Bacteroidota bacterium]